MNMQYIFSTLFSTVRVTSRQLFFIPENIALGKPATQLGTFKDNVAGRAVDGNTSQNLNDGSCAHPYSSNETLPAAVRESRAWWSVDLSAGDPTMTYVITSVTIYFRGAHSRKTYFCSFLYLSSLHYRIK